MNFFHWHHLKIKDLMSRWIRLVKFLSVNVTFLPEISNRDHSAISKCEDDGNTCTVRKWTTEKIQIIDM